MIVPQETINASKEYKKKHRTLRQLPLYRDMANFKYLVAKMLSKCPRKLTKFYDGMLMTVSEAKKCVGLGEASRDNDARAEYLSMGPDFWKNFYVKGHMQSVRSHKKNRLINQIQAI